MEIELGSIIKIICSNNVVESGKLIEHTDKQMVLELFDKSIFIVQNPLKNVISIKFTLKESSNPSKVFIEDEPKPDQYYIKEDLRAKSLAELHKLKAEEERRRARDLLISKKIENLPEVEFGYPNFTKSVPKHFKKKA